MTNNRAKALEAWRTVTSIPSLEYEVSSLGRIRNIKTGTIRKHSVDVNGYERISVQIKSKRVTKKIHTLVAEAFLGERSGRNVNHMDGNKINNNIYNLEYVSARENTTHGKNTKKRFTGATFNKVTKRWVSQMKMKNKCIYIGSFNTEKEASEAYHAYLIEIEMENKYAR